MAEPRKPRVIKTRLDAIPAPKVPGEDSPAQGTDAGAAGKSSGIQGKDAGAAGKNTTGQPASGAVRSTSSKVTVQPLTAPDATPGTAAGATETGKAADTAETGKTADVSSPGKVARLKTASARVAGKVSSAKSAKSAKPVQSGPAKAGAKAPGKTAGAGSAKSVRTAPEKAGAKAATGGAPTGEGTDAGAQVLAFPLPPHKRRRRNILYGLAGVVVVLALVMSFALFSPALAVKTVVFQGRKLVAEETLQAALAPVLGTPLPQISEAEVQDLLKPVVQVKSATIEARPPSTLLVRVVERVPVALIMNGDNYLLVDQDGVELGSTPDPASVALPLIDGGKEVIGQQTFNAMTAVLANLPQGILEQLANATAASPDAVELKLVDGRSVIWGDASDMELKAQVLEALLTAPPPTAAAGKPEPALVQVFDVSAPRHPVTR